MFTRNDAIAAETAEARALGVPESLAHAIASVESGHDPYAIGDHGTSFGDYQLHVGGLLGNLTREQAFDPRTNAHVALSHLAETRRKYPSVRDPGALAALSQGPADREAYRVAVDRAMQTGPAGGSSSSSGVQTGELAGFHVPGPGTVWRWTKEGGGWVLHGVGGAAGDAGSAVGGAISAPFVAIYNLAKGVWEFFTSADTWIRVGLFVGGFVILIAGARKAFGGSSGGGTSIVPIPV